MRLYVYRISTRCYGQEMKQRLTNLCDQEKLPLQLQEEAHEGLYSVRCTFATPLKKDRDAEIFGQIQRYYFVQALADALQQCAERQCILKHLKKEYAWSDKDIEERGDWVIARLNVPEQGNKGLRAKELMRGLFKCLESEPAVNAKLKTSQKKRLY